MNYSKHYTLLIERAKNRKLNGYIERHHIMPVCLGGTNSKENIVELTPEEHYVAHQLLVKMYPNSKGLVWAAIQMTRHQTKNRKSNKLYGWLKRKNQKIAKQRTGTKNGSYGKAWYYNPVTKECQKFKHLIVPEGWYKGRVLDWNLYELNQKKIQEKKKIEQEKKDQKKKKLIRQKHLRIRRSHSYRKAKSQKLYKKFVESELSLREFSKLVKMNPMTLSKWFTSLIPEYDIKPRINASKQR